MYYAHDMYGKVHEKNLNKQEAEDFLKSIERLCDVLRCEWEYTTQSEIVVKVDGKVINIFVMVKS